ncbi:MAG: response regulator transcription factor [Chloroflexota bacterium]|nr:response regulator transcription factor [Chloroflexota bacterium]
MISTAKILVVDDEANIRASLEEILTRDGYQVVAVGSGEAALELVSGAAHTFDLALIDLKMEGVGGIEVLAALRQQSPDTVAIVLTAHASLETAVDALRHGAHDYLFKPCKPAELRESIRKGLLSNQEARQRDLLRQIEHMADSLEDIRATIVSQVDRPPSTVVQPTEGPRRFLQREGLIVDFLRHVITVDGHLLDLSPTEFDLLSYLIREAPRVIPPQELVREVQGYESEQWEASETVRQHVYRVRQKIKEATGRVDVIRTVRGVGYRVGE